MHKSINVLKYPKRQIMILYILHQKQSLICLKTHGSLKMLSKTTTAGQVSIPWLSILCRGLLHHNSHRWCKSLRSLMLLAAAQAWNIQVSWCCHKWSFPKKLHGLPLPFLTNNDFTKLTPKLFHAVGMTKRSDDHILTWYFHCLHTKSQRAQSIINANIASHKPALTNHPSYDHGMLLVGSSTFVAKDAHS